MKKILLPFICACVGFVSPHAQNIPNPVIPRVADAGVMKYNGKYYIGGVGTNGDFYISQDLIHWSEPVHAITMDNEWTQGTGAKTIKYMQTICSTSMVNFIFTGQ